jgi:hypothetical protein
MFENQKKILNFLVIMWNKENSSQKFVVQRQDTVSVTHCNIADFLSALQSSHGEMSWELAVTPHGHTCF